MRSLLTGLLAAGMLVMAPGGHAQPVSTQRDGPGVTRTSVKIGAWLPMEGPAAVYGSALRAGLESYYGTVNDRGGVNGRKIELVIEEAGRDPQRTVAAARKLIERDEVFAIVAPFGTAQTAATFSYVLDEAKVPIVNVYGGLREWYQPVRPYLFGVMVAYEDQARALGRWAAKEGAKNILVVHNDPAAYEKVAKSVAPGAATANASAAVKLLAVKLGTSDYAPIGLQVANGKPDAIVMILPVDEAVALAKALARQGVKVPLYTYAPSVSLDLLALGGEAIEGLRSVSWTVPPTADLPAVEEYRQALKKHAPGAKADFNSLFAWAQAKIFVEALSRVTGPLTREGLVGALHGMSNFETRILPPVTFSATSHLGVKGLQPVMVEKGAWKLVGGFVDPNGQW